MRRSRAPADARTVRGHVRLGPDKTGRFAVIWQATVPADAKPGPATLTAADYATAEVTIRSR